MTELGSLPEDLKPAEPKVVEVDYSSDVRVIDERKIEACFSNFAVFLKRVREKSAFRYYISVYAGGAPVKNVFKGDIVDASDLDDLNLDVELKNRLKFYISAWDLMLEKSRAEIYLNARIKVVPKVSDREIIAERIADAVLEDTYIKTFTVSQGGRTAVIGMYCYDGGYYRECEEEVEKKVEKYIRGYELQEGKVTKWVVSEVIGKIMRRTYEDYRPAKHALLFRDKVFSWDRFLETKDFEKSLTDPSPDLVVEHRIPWRINLEMWSRARRGLEKYIPPKDWKDIIEIFKNTAPKSCAAFLSWVKSAEESEEEAQPKVVLLLEIIGYALYPHGYPLHSAVLLVGSGSNGKSTYLRLIEAILSKENVVSINLRDLDTRYNKFAAADLHGKLANISTEPVKGTFDATLFKQLTGEDLVRFERKFRDSFYGTNYAKMMFSANELPQVTEDTFAFWRRWIVVEFPNQFPEDQTFFEKTFTQEEVEGIILCALHAFRLVLERRSFTKIGTKDPKEEWMKRSSPVYRAVRRLIEEGVIAFDRDGWVVKDDLYNLYSAVAREEDEEVVSKKRFTEDLERLFSVKSSEVRYGGRHLRVYRGVRIANWERAQEILGELKTPRTLGDSV